MKDEEKACDEVMAKGVAKEKESENKNEQEELAIHWSSVSPSS